MEPVKHPYQNEARSISKGMNQNTCTKREHDKCLYLHTKNSRKNNYNDDNNNDNNCHNNNNNKNRDVNGNRKCGIPFPPIGFPWEWEPNCLSKWEWD